MVDFLKIGAKDKDGLSRGVLSNDKGNLIIEPKQIEEEFLLEQQVVAKGGRVNVNVNTPHNFRILIKIHDNIAADWLLSQLPFIESQPGQEWLTRSNRQTFMEDNGASFIVSNIQEPLYEKNRLLFEHSTTSDFEEITFSMAIIHYPTAQSPKTDLASTQIALPVDVQYSMVENIEEIIAETVTIPSDNSVRISKFDVSQYKYINVIAKTTDASEGTHQVTLSYFDKSWAEEYGYDTRTTLSYNTRQFMTGKIEVLSPVMSVSLANTSSGEKPYWVSIVGFKE